MTGKDLYGPVVDSLSTAVSGGTHVQKRIGAIRVLDVHAAKRVADDLDALLVEASTVTLKNIKEWPQSRGFEVAPETINSGRDGRTRLHLQLKDARYREEFRALCANICEVIAPLSDETQAIRDLHRRLVRWKSFLGAFGFDGLGEEARCGLFGELLVLRDLLLPCLGPGTVVRAWKGCKKAHQDYQFSDCALEVKTSRATILDRISISNVQQLDHEGIEHMFLSVVHVNENESSGETLPEMIDAIRALLPDDARDNLDLGLEQVGYIDAHRNIYAATRYQHLDTHHFRVSDDFPRLTRDQIPDGIKKVRYDLTIDACRPFRIDQAEMLSQLGEAHNDN